MSSTIGQFQVQLLCINIGQNFGRLLNYDMFLALRTEIYKIKLFQIRKNQIHFSSLRKHLIEQKLTTASLKNYKKQYVQFKLFFVANCGNTYILRFLTIF